MDCCCERKPMVHRQIEKMIKQDRKRKKKEIRLLFLGKHGSGKTTLFRQFQIIYGNTYSDDMKGYIKRHIYRNTYVAMQTLIQAMRELEIPFQLESNDHMATEIASIDTYDTKLFPPEHAQSIKLLWADEGTQKCYRRREEYSISNSAKYFLDAVDRISKADYSPSNQDMVMVTIPSTGLQEYAFEHMGYLFRLTEYKGFRVHRERRIWLQFFENVDVLVFVIDVSVYNIFVDGEENLNELEEALELFKVIISYPWFSGKSIVLFFNKIDIFQEKIMRFDLDEYIPGYTGPKQNVESACEYIKQKFLDLNQAQDKPIFPHFTCAIDTPSMERVFENMLQTVIQSNVMRFRVF